MNNTDTTPAVYEATYADNVPVVDAGLGLSPVAWAMLTMLADETMGCDFTKAAESLDDGEDLSTRLSFKTFAFYNGRERGACIIVRDMAAAVDAPVLFVSFGECRSSDDKVFVDHWTAPLPSDSEPPTVEDMPGGYDEMNRQIHGGVTSAIQTVRKVIEDHVNKEVSGA